MQVKTKAYVLNPELEDEYDILKRSQLYELSNDSLNSVKIRLKPLQENLMCGNPLLGTVITFGLIPSAVEDNYLYSFTELNNESTVEREINVRVRMRLSIYEIFYRGNMNQQIADGLREGYGKK